MHDIIKAAIFTPTYKGWGLPLLFWGEPGVAKSDIIEDVGRSYGLHVEVLSPGERGEGAFGVTPMPVARGNTHYITYPAPEWVLKLEEHDGRGIVFVDELNTAQGSAKPALLGLIQAKRIGGEYLGALTRVMGAANPPDDAADGSDLPASTANRLGHVQWHAPSVQAWSQWLMALDGSATAAGSALVQHFAALEEQRVLAAWAEPFAAARGLVTGFLGAKSGQLHQKPGMDSPELSRAWPSRRTWYLATCALASCGVHGLKDEARFTLLKAFVGKAAAEELFKWEASLDLPLAADVLDGHVHFEHDPTRLDITRAVLNSCAMLVADPKCDDRASRLDAMWDILAAVIDARAVDLAMQAARVVARAQPFDGGKRTSDHKVGQKVLAALHPAMKAAGYAG